MQKRDIGQEQRKAALWREAEEATAHLLQEAVEWQAAHADATWDELETEVLELRQRFGAQLVRVLAQQRAAAQPVPGPRCPECGEEMHYKGQKERQVVSLLGEVPLERGYYYCSACKRGVFPPGSGAGTEETDVESAADAGADMAGRTTAQ